MKVLYRQTANDDIVRQFRYYLLTAQAPEIALRFRPGCQAYHPIAKPKILTWVRNILLAIRNFKISVHGLSLGFEAIRIYYAPLQGKSQQA